MTESPIAKIRRCRNLDPDLVDKLLAEWDATVARLESAIEFRITGTIRICKCFGYRLPKEPMWKVMEHGAVLAKDGEWEIEPQPSSRDDEFCARCRFDTFEEAHAAALKAIAGEREGTNGQSGR